MQYESKAKLRRLTEEEFDSLIGNLRSDSEDASKQAGKKLVREAYKYGCDLRTYLRLAVAPDGDLNGYERTLLHLGLPVRDDFDHGVTLEAASDTFQTYPGTRAMFPEVIDDMVRWDTRQDMHEIVEPMLAVRRPMQGNELLSTIINDDPDATQSTAIIPEGAKIPISTIRTEQKSVQIFKIGKGIRTTYEFDRRASLDILRPFLNRVARELERTKVLIATNIMINGDGAYGAASTKNQSNYDASTGTTSTAGTINWDNFIWWLIQRAKAGVPVDSVLMNWDALFQWQRAFSKPTVLANGVDVTPVEEMGRQGIILQPHNAAMNIRLTPVLSSAMPAGQLLGYIRAETMEELQEVGSDIEERAQHVETQTTTVVRTENVGYRLPFGDTREIYDFDA